MVLFRKELRALRPFLWLVAVLVALDMVIMALTEFPDQYTLGEVFDDFDATFAYFILFVIAFAIGQTLIQREKGEGTLEFIDALPVSRGRVYWTKWLAGFFVLAIYLFASLGPELLFHLWSSTSENPSLYAEFWGPMLVMDLAVNAIYISIGIALAFWGRFGILAAGFYLIGAWILRESQVPGANRFDPLIFGRFDVTGSTLHIPWKILGGQLLGAGALAILGRCAFERLGRSYDSGGGAWRWVAAPLFAIGVVGGIITWIVAGVIFVADDEAVAEASAGPAPEYPAWETSRLKTGRLVFIYPNNLAGTAEALAAEADDIHDTVTGFLGAESKRELVVDLTSRSPRHAGTAYWGRIRMNIQSKGLESRLPAVLGHELCHVYIDQLSENRVSERFDATRFFHEGLASLVEYRFFRPPDELIQIRRVAAAAFDRESLRFEDLVSSRELSGRYASEWVYPLGEIFIAAVIEIWGDDAPSALIRAFNRPDAPKNLQGITLWQDTFQAAGYDLETAVAGFFRLLETTAESERDWLDQLPRLRGQLVADGDRIGVRIRSSQADSGEVGLPPRGQLSVRFRAGQGASENEYRVGRVDKEHVAWISRAHFPAGAVDFQIVHSPEAKLMMPLFSRWISARVPGAR